jgi:hypothetical protein
MATNRAKPIPRRASGAVANTAPGRVDGRVCPSVCPSDWDKCKTPFVTSSRKGSYEGRQKTERRGQETDSGFS